MRTPDRKPDGSAPRPLSRIFAMPALLAVASVVGLLCALLGDGPWDAMSWAGLGLVVAVAAWYGRPRPRGSSS